MNFYAFGHQPEEAPMNTFALERIKLLILTFTLFSLASPPTSVNFFGISSAFAANEENYDEYNEDPIVVKQPYPGPYDEQPGEEDPPVTQEPPANPEPPVVDTPAPMPEPPPAQSPGPEPIPEPVKYRCDLLVDKTGVYLSMFNSKYIAVSNVTECMLNEANGIKGSCDNQKLITVLRSEQVPMPNELTLSHDSLVTLVEEEDPSLFLCFSWTHGLILKVENTKVVIINPAKKKSRNLFGF